MRRNEHRHVFPFVLLQLLPLGKAVLKYDSRGQINVRVVKLSWPPHGQESFTTRTVNGQLHCMFTLCTYFPSSLTYA